MGMIGRWLSEQDDEVLGRLAVVPDRRWVHGSGILNEHGGCLLAHAYASGHAYGPNGSYRSYDDGEIAVRFDRLCMRFSEDRIGRAISERAKKLLNERRAGTLIEETCPLKLVDIYLNGDKWLPTNREPFREEATVS